MTPAERVAKKIRELLDKEVIEQRSFVVYDDGSVSREAASDTDVGCAIFTVLTADGEFDVHITPIDDGAGGPE